ncbi:4a-hydroxytetrahydrobiopterin dehydratase [Brevibacterium sp. K11IcPPYGO002]|uniref:4a-hydroxytetrahydrobiopterin dehydratase n=1 Tax=Brevibacterium sp. K11IcPPYGO002 TaxID=3058837 RepID=UPI003D819445
MTAYTGQKLLDALDSQGLGDWQGLPDCIGARFLTGDFATGLDFVARIGAAAEEAGHHPDVTLTFPHVDIRLTSHDTGAVTERDLNLAGQISELAASTGVKADPTIPALLELGLDTANQEAIAPFWAALLTGDASNVSGPDVVDPAGQMPLLWFQDCEEHEVPHQRLHVDVSVPAAVAADRIKAAVDAGGTIVDESHAPSFTVLADADGNRACVCTLAARP